MVVVVGVVDKVGLDLEDECVQNKAEKYSLCV